MTPSEVGTRTEAEILAALVASGRGVLVPFASHCRYDLVFEQDGRFHRVQCKTGRLVRGAVTFRTHSTTGGRLSDYGDAIDFFGVYCQNTGTTYLVPVADVPGRGATLRITPPANGQRAGIRWGSTYALPRLGVGAAR